MKKTDRLYLRCEVAQGGLSGPRLTDTLSPFVEMAGWLDAPLVCLLRLSLGVSLPSVSLGVQALGRPTFTI